MQCLGTICQTLRRVGPESGARWDEMVGNRHAGGEKSSGDKQAIR
jgi:hypothetical protein